MPQVRIQSFSDADCAVRTRQLDERMRFLWIPGRRKKLAIESFNLGRDCRDNGNATLAQANFGRVLALFKDKHPSRFKDSLQVFALVAASHNHLGLLCLDAGHPADARSSFDRAVEIRRELQRLFPNDRENQIYLGGSLCNLAHSVADSDPAEAIEFYQQSLSILRQPNRTCECSYWDEHRQSWWCEQLEAIAGPLRLQWVALAPQFIDNAMQGLSSIEPSSPQPPHS